MLFFFFGMESNEKSVIKRDAKETGRQLTVSGNSKHKNMGNVMALSYDPSWKKLKNLLKASLYKIVIYYVQGKK